MSLTGQPRVADGCSIVRVGTELSSLIAAVEANQIEAEFPTDNLTGLKHAKIHGFMCDEVRCKPSGSVGCTYVDAFPTLAAENQKSDMRC